MIEHARRQVPDGDLRVGPTENPPWHDDTFDVVTTFNALHEHASPRRRVLWADGVVWRESQPRPLRR